ncbi:hypothetical protein CDIK_0301, partial [Cucumispora dikerogammari]
CQSFSIVENSIKLEYTNLKRVSRLSIKDSINKLFILCKEKCSEILSEKFCLAFDGWTENNLHSIAIYAKFPAGNKTSKTILLSCNTLLNETNWIFESYVDTIEAVLKSFGKNIFNVVCLTRG